MKINWYFSLVSINVGRYVGAYCSCEWYGIIVTYRITTSESIVKRIDTEDLRLLFSNESILPLDDVVVCK